MGHLIGSWSKQKDAIRDGPSGGGGGGGGWEWAGGGEFSSRGKFFWLSNSLYEFFLVDSMNIL